MNISIIVTGILSGLFMLVLLSNPWNELTAERDYYKADYDDFNIRLERVQKEHHEWKIPLDDCMWLLRQKQQGS